MPRPKLKAPAPRFQLSRQSVVTIDGRDFYLGKHLALNGQKAKLGLR
jgi:hypothetical protein